MIAGLFMKKDYHIERNVTIDAQKDKVFDYIKYLKNQDNYSFWNKQDPEMTKTIPAMMVKLDLFHLGLGMIKLGQENKK